MKNYEELYNLMNSKSFMNRLTVAIIHVSRDIRHENPNTENHAKRLEWATANFTSSNDTAVKMFWEVVMNDNVYKHTKKCTDKHLYDAVVSVLPAVIG
ncbi:MAG: hypothetical protein GY749_33585 [Desulfobacteraceae bacterium]|nr:hypothetical protein [Desulfobacteraceae bacterium]